MDIFYKGKITINKVPRPYLKYLSQWKISLDGIETTLPRLDTLNVSHLDIAQRAPRWDQRESLDKRSFIPQEYQIFQSC
jgi:hypothetical protein